MTNGSHPHKKAGGKKAAKSGTKKQKPAAAVLTKGLARKGGTKGTARKP